ncbi:hypothetical protein [Leifsonia poae]|uniref:Uncharacterized protein n=1 Tax=Leifsonia poae TaxID=110933 RepID=A0A9W6HD21_9MICO|nr:hypothetical protein [Leifsonia poae]GLJ77921.1 hypothetical protein GCM10017584_34950 [Leifsonia poae]
MTLWQDPPPQTRRQARENERSQAEKAAGQASRRAGTAEPTPAGEIPTMTTPYTFTAGRTDDDQEPEKPAIPATAFAEPGVTAPSRPNLPSYGSSFDALLSPESDSDSSSASDDSSEPDAGLYRQPPVASVQEPVTTPVALVPDAVRPADAASTPSPATPASVTQGPASPAAPVDQERTLTRRELRAMLQAQEANQQAGHIEPTIPVTFTPPAAADETATAAAAPAASPDSTPDTSTPSAWPFGSLTPSSATPAASPAAGAPSTPAPPVFTPPTFAPVTPAEPPVAAPAAPAAATPEAPAAVPEAVDPSEERQPYTPPVGHWSTAAELDDKNQPFDQIISRNVGQSGSATTTNALILPVLPTPDATGPLTSTGEILVTGSIDLPRGLGATGAHPNRIDSSDLDRLLEGDENEFNTSEVAPIRASRAVSTHTSTRGVITPPKKRGGRLPVVLSITAAVLGVGVIGLLIAAYVLNVF